MPDLELLLERQREELARHLVGAPGKIIGHAVSDHDEESDLRAGAPDLARAPYRLTIGCLREWSDRVGRSEKWSH